MTEDEIAGATVLRETTNSEKVNLRQQMRRARDAMPPAERAWQSTDVCRRLASLPEVRRAGLIACYLAFGSELDLRPFMAELIDEAASAIAGSASKAGSPAQPATDTVPDIALPVTLEDRRLEFVRFDALEAVHPESLPRCLREPARPLPEVPAELAERVVEPREIDVVILPGLAFDLQGGRLGYGGGYYDAWLSETFGAQEPARRDASATVLEDGQSHPVPSRPLLIGACFDCQLLPAGRTLPRDPHDIPVDLVVWPNGCQGTQKFPL